MSEQTNCCPDHDNGKTLYVSDLDGTLLRSDEKTSEYTNRVVNSLTDKGILFSYATARSWITARKVTKGIDAKIPLIVYNGSFIVDNVSGKILKGNYFDRTAVNDLLDELFIKQIYPIVYSYIDEAEKFSYVPELGTVGLKKFTDSRKGDIRENPVSSSDDLRKGDIFYVTCIDTPEKLFPIYEKYKDKFHCVYQVDIYTDEQWLEIMPMEASKANAVKQLKDMYQCDKVVAFGDGKNDIDMFSIADEGYAVSNAHEDLKKVATGIIGSNNEDGVAKWLETKILSLEKICAMDVYEKKLSEEINAIAGKQVFFDVDLITELDRKTTEEIVGYLLSWACSSQNDRPITLGRTYLTKFSKEWVTERIMAAAPAFLDLGDYWDYRRLMEVSKMISDDLFRWAHEQGRGSDDPDVAEAYEDYKAR
ncbi:MAG: HAD family hydrolase [Clostridiales bacterium]|nr:HAD family hydrolase [Clostridiales bacterium]